MNHDPIMSTGRDRKTWTAKEDEQLRNAVLQTIQDSRPLMWRDLAKSVPGRSNKDCRRRWWNTLAGCTVKGPWSESEDERLMHAVGSYGPQWTQVAAAVGTRHSDQCSSHWTQVLDPDINHSDFTPDEDCRLLQAVKSQGTNWTGISAHHTPRRTTLALKNRYATLQTRPTTDRTGNASLPDEPPSQRTHKRSITSIESPIFSPMEKQMLPTTNFQSEARDPSHSFMNNDLAQYQFPSRRDGVDIQGPFNQKGNLTDSGDCPPEGLPTCAGGRPGQLRKDHAPRLHRYPTPHAIPRVLAYSTDDNIQLGTTFSATHPGVHGAQQHPSEDCPPSSALERSNYLTGFSNPVIAAAVTDTDAGTLSQPFGTNSGNGPIKTSSAGMHRMSVDLQGTADQMGLVIQQLTTIGTSFSIKFEAPGDLERHALDRL
ncbi:hypothetical protein F4823DRAFT_611535 [Ustulina deusta]|nr:hypothetical protein F4823DRAFT_611535 [Ustulina deusta]